MGDSELRVPDIELERMARLAVRRKTDPLIKAAAWLRFVAIIAVQLLSVHRRNVIGEMALVIETEHVRITRLLLDELEFRMELAELREGDHQPVQILVRMQSGNSQ